MFKSEFIKNFTALIISVVVVHLIYIGFIRPEANLLLEIAMQTGKTPPRDIAIILKDYEQEICFILMFWGGFMILNKCSYLWQQNYIFTDKLAVKNEQGELDIKKFQQQLATLSEKRQDYPLIQTLQTGLSRYQATANIQNLSDTIDSNVEALAVSQDADNSMIRYLIWAIPSIGFIGTVRGIGEALSLADQALAGDISGMTNSLGVAFISTLVALVISILLMFLFHQLQKLQDDQVTKTRSFCNKYVILPLEKMQQKR